MPKFPTTSHAESPSSRAHAASKPSGGLLGSFTGTTQPALDRSEDDDDDDDNDDDDDDEGDGEEEGF